MSLAAKEFLNNLTCPKCFIIVLTDFNFVSICAYEVVITPVSCLSVLKVMHTCESLA